MGRQPAAHREQHSYGSPSSRSPWKFSFPILLFSKLEKKLKMGRLDHLCFSERQCYLNSDRLKSKKT